VSVWSYSVQLNDPSGAGGSADATLVYDLQQAIGFWTQYILGAGTLVVTLNIQNTTQGRESGGPSVATFAGTNGGLNLYEGAAQYELTTGQHVSGYSSDITINIDPGYFQYLDLDQGLSYYSDVPANKYNPIVVFLHELMHGFGMFTYYDQAGNLAGNYESTFDKYIVKTGSGAVFTGPNAEAVYGGPVPITTDSTAGENYGHFGNTISDISRSPFAVQDPLTLDLMNGIVFYFDYRYPISALDLAVLKDLGYSLRTTPVVTAPDYAATRGQGVPAAFLFGVSAAAGDSITAYQVWDSTPDSSSGYWVVGGTPQPAGQAINFSQLSSAYFHAWPGTDQLWVRASDGVLWSDWKSFNVNVVDQTPVVSASNQAASHLQFFAAASLFSVTDGDGDSITAYQFWDSTNDPTSGYWIVGGVSQGAGHAIDVTPAQLSSATFQSGSGTDLLWVHAYDGFQWGNWTSFNVSAPVEHAPTVSTHDYAARHFEDIAAASLFSVSDADGDPITAYQLWDSTFDPASGHWVVDGAAQPVGHAINVTPTQFTNATFQSGSGSDQLWVRATDGALWSDWMSFNVVAPVDHAPVTSAHDYGAIHLENIAAASLFSVLDADSDAMTTYQFWDSTPDASSGEWIVGNVAQPAGQAITVTAAQLSTTTFQSGAISDLLWVRASDGALWSDWTSFNVVSPGDRAPIVSGSDVSLTVGNRIALTSLFGATDPDGDAIKSYELWQSVKPPGSEYGTFDVGGPSASPGQGIFLDATTINQAHFYAASTPTTDRIWERASDGALWSDWHVVNVAAHT